jgi:YHS domain-containing protein
MSESNVVSDLATRLQREIDQAKGHISQFQEEAAAKAVSLKARYEQFEAVRARLARQFEPRIKAITERIKDAKVDTDRNRDGGEVRLHMGHTDLIPPAVTLRFVLSHGGSVETLALDYYLSIIPVLFDYRSHDHIEMPIASIDDAKLLAWMDDRIIEFTRVYLQIPFIEGYHDKNRVTDPVGKVSFNKLMAKGTIEHKGKTYHFASENAMTEFKREPDKYATA